MNATEGTEDLDNELTIIRNSLNELDINKATDKLSTLGLNPELSQQILTMAKSNNLLKGSTDEIAEGIAKVGQSSSTIDNLSNTFKGLGLSIKSLATAHPILAAITAITVAIGIAVKAYDALTISREEAETAAKEAKSRISEIKSEFDNAKSSVNDIKQEYAQLAQGVDNLGRHNQSRGSLSIDEYKQFLDLGNQLYELFPELIVGFDDNGNAILNLAGNVDTIVGSLNNLVAVQQQLANEQILENMPELWTDYAYDIKDYQKQIKNLEQEQRNLNKIKTLEKDTTVTNGTTSLSFTVADNNSLDKAIKKSIEEMGYGIGQLSHITSGNNRLWNFSNLTESELESLRNNIDIKSALDEVFQEYEQSIQEFEAKTDVANAEIASYINTWLSGEGIYLSQDSEMKAIMQDALLNTDWLKNLPSDVYASDWDEVSKWLTEDFLTSIQNIDDKAIQAELRDVYNSDFTYSQIETLKDTLTKLEKDGGYGLSQNNPLVLWVTGKFTERTEKETNIKQALLKGQNTSFASNLSNEDLDIANKIVSNLGSGTKLTVAELQTLITKYKTNTGAAIDDIRVNTISNINDMSTGFEKLGKIYSSISDNDPFDFNLLDDENFKDAFSSLESYSDFIETITNNTDDIDACTEAFNGLLTEWINSTGILNNVTSENEKLTISMLKQMGVANAETVVSKALSKNQETAKAQDFYKNGQYNNRIKNLRTTNNQDKWDATSQEDLSYLMEQAEVAGIATNAYAGLLAQEIWLNNTTLNTDGKIKALQFLSQYVQGVTVDYQTLQDVINGKEGAMSKREFATQNNIKIVETDRWYKDKNGKLKNNWLYKYNGEEYETLDQAYAAKSQYELSNAQYTPIKYDGNSSSEETKESFNWIETALSRIQRTISNLGKTVSATYKSWGERNSALAQQMSTVSHEIDLQNQAYTNYMTLANNVGLDPYYQRLVQTGNIDLGNKEVDSATAEKIKKYQEYYEAALAAEDARIDLEAERMNLIQTNFDSIAKQYDDQLSLIEHEANSLNSSIDMIEKEGHVVTEDLYKSLIQNADQQMALLQNKAIELQSAMSGVATGTEMWYSLNSELLGIQEELDSLTSSTLDWNNAIRDLDWDKFDRILEKMSALNSEADFLMELISNENMYSEDGTVTESGQATKGLLAINYTSKMAQANEIIGEIQSLDADYANDSENLTYLERRNELEQQYRDLILDAKDDEQSFIDMQKEQYDALLDHMSEVIDKRKDMLSKAKDAYDYEKNISEQTEEVAKLEKQLSAYQGDTSEESRTTVQQLKVSLADAKENLEETQYEKYINDQEQMLDSLYDETEEWMNERLDNVDSLLQNVISSADSNAQAIIATLQNANISMDAIPNFEELVQHIPSATQTIESVNNTQLQEPTTTTNNNVVNHNTFEFNLPNVTNGEETITYLQHSKRFENIIHEIAFGNGSFGKYKY